MTSAFRLNTHAILSFCMLCVEFNYSGSIISVKPQREFEENKQENSLSKQTWKHMHCIHSTTALISTPTHRSGMIMRGFQNCKNSAPSANKHSCKVGWKTCLATSVQMSQHTTWQGEPRKQIHILAIKRYKWSPWSVKPRLLSVLQPKTEVRSG